MLLNINKKLLHTSVVNRMDNPITNTIMINESSRENNEMALMIIEKDYLTENLLENQSSETSEVFPGLIDDDGNMIDFNKNLNVFEAVEVISYILKKKYEVDTDSTIKIKLDQVTKLFEESNRITVLDLYNYVSQIYKEDPNFYKHTADNLSNNLMVENKQELFNPLAGEKSLNEFSRYILNLKWETILPMAQVTIHAVPSLLNFVSYGVMVRSYMKLIYNRPIPKGLNEKELNTLKKSKNIQLALFSLIGAPLGLVLVKMAAPSFKDMLTFNFSFNSQSEVENNVRNNSLFLFLGNFINKIPFWFKVIFKIILISLLGLKLLGISIFEFYNNIYYLEIYCLVLCILYILYECVNLYLLHIFSTKKNKKIPDVLPNFFIDWLNSFKVLSSNELLKNETKKNCYVHISLYLVIMLFIIIII
uniref:Uncharacterized protein n=1 Tax=Trametes cingulata TaxID=575983 RepID=D3YNM4_9APHY|nr:hypothetical protein TrcifM_p12 [Trametes cingulata]ADD21057.1 hypothetical protein [Trametes cingulata]